MKMYDRVTFINKNDIPEKAIIVLLIDRGSMAIIELEKTIGWYRDHIVPSNYISTLSNTYFGVSIDRIKLCEENKEENQQQEEYLFPPISTL